MVNLPFHQTKSEYMVRIAATTIFQRLHEYFESEKLKNFTEKPQYGYTTSAADEILRYKFIRITDLKDGQIDWDTVPYCECDRPEKYLLSDGDILFARTGTTGKTHLINSAPDNAVFASYLIRLRSNSYLSAEYLYAFFQSNQYWQQIVEAKRGSAQLNVNATQLSDIMLPVAVEPQLQLAIANFLDIVRKRQSSDLVPLPELPHPLEEQRRIVAHIQALAQRIEGARGLRQEAMGDVERLLNSFRREYLACGGDTTIGDFAKVSSGFAFKRSWYTPSGIRLVRNVNIGHGSISWDNPSRLPENLAPEFERFRLSEGDVLVSLDRPLISTGVKAAMITSDDLPSLLVQRVGKFNFYEDNVLPEFMLAWLQSPHFSEAIDPGRSNGVPHISQKNIEQLSFSPPPITEQKDIIFELNRLCALIDVLRNHQANTAKELDALLPSLLDRVFN